MSYHTIQDQQAIAVQIIAGEATISVKDAFDKAKEILTYANKLRNQESKLEYDTRIAALDAFAKEPEPGSVVYQDREGGRWKVDPDGPFVFGSEKPGGFQQGVPYAVTASTSSFDKHGSVMVWSLPDAGMGPYSITRRYRRA